MGRRGHGSLCPLWWERNTQNTQQLRLEEIFEGGLVSPVSQSRANLDEVVQDFISWRFCSLSGPLFEYLTTIMAISPQLTVSRCLPPCLLCFHCACLRRALTYLIYTLQLCCWRQWWEPYLAFSFRGWTNLILSVCPCRETCFRDLQETRSQTSDCPKCFKENLQFYWRFLIHSVPLFSQNWHQQHWFINF